MNVKVSLELICIKKERKIVNNNRETTSLKRTFVFLNSLFFNLTFKRKEKVK